MTTRHPAPLTDGLRRDAARLGYALRGAASLDESGKGFVSHVGILTHGKDGWQAKSKRTSSKLVCHAVSMSKNLRTPQAVAVGARIARARKDLGLSQAQLAAQLGVTNGAVGGWESGLKSPKREHAHNIAVLLGVSMDWLLTGNEPEEQRRAQTIAEAEALALLRGMAPDKQASAMAMLRGLAGKPPSEK